MTLDSITWLRQMNVVNIKRNSGYVPGYVYSHLEDDCLRITVGFSEDKMTMYFKPAAYGVKLSAIGGNSKPERSGRSFSVAMNISFQKSRYLGELEHLLRSN